jgi:uncharacterized protein
MKYISSAARHMKIPDMNKIPFGFDAIYYNGTRIHNFSFPGGVLSMTISISMGNVTLKAEFFDTDCAKAIVAKLPMDTLPNVWGDEFYFEIPVSMELDETATTTVSIGDIGYWPPGRALAIFFGPTPMSSGPDPVPASEVNIVGRISGDATILKNSKGKGKIRIEKS